MATKKLFLDQLATYGGAMLVQLTDADTDLASETRDAALALERYRLKAEEFGKSKAEIEGNTRFSEAGRKAELGDYCIRALSELGRADALLEKAQAQLAELVAEARQVPADALTPAEVAMVPAVYARLQARDPLELPAILAQAAEARDVVTLQAFLAGPSCKELRLAVTDEQLDEARDAMAGKLPADERAVLNRLRELVDAATSTRKALVAELKRTAGLERDPLAAMLGAEPGRVQADPIARMALGFDAEDGATQAAA